MAALAGVGFASPWKLSNDLSLGLTLLWNSFAYRYSKSFALPLGFLSEKTILYAPSASDFL